MLGDYFEGKPISELNDSEWEAWQKTRKNWVKMPKLKRVLYDYGEQKELRQGEILIGYCSEFRFFNFVKETNYWKTARIGKQFLKNTRAYPLFIKKNEADQKGWRIEKNIWENFFVDMNL